MGAQFQFMLEKSEQDGVIRLKAADGAQWFIILPDGMTFLTDDPLEEKLILVRLSSFLAEMIVNNPMLEKWLKS